MMSKRPEPGYAPTARYDGVRIAVAGLKQLGTSMMSVELDRTDVARFVKFVLVGLSNMTIFFGVYAALIALGVWYVIATAIAYFIGLANGYTLNRRWTFRSGAAHHVTAAKYVIVQLAGLVLSIALIVSCVQVLHFDKLASQALCLLAIAPATFALNRLWIFPSGGGRIAPATDGPEIEV